MAPACSGSAWLTDQFMKSVHDHLLRADACDLADDRHCCDRRRGLCAAGFFRSRMELVCGLRRSATALLRGRRMVLSLCPRRKSGLVQFLSAQRRFIGFAAVAGPLSYIAATAGFPLQDAAFSMLGPPPAFRLGADDDFHLGASRIAARPVVRPIPASSLQTVIDGTRAWHGRPSLHGSAPSLSHSSATALITIAISAVLPATGPWLFLDLHSADGNMASFRRRRPVGRCSSGFVTARCIPSTASTRKELLTFPSLHAASSILFAARALACKGSEVDRVGPESSDADGHTRLWKPLFRRCDRRDSACSGVLDRRRPHGHGEFAK